MLQDNDGLVNATVRRWQLTEALRQLREDKGLTIRQATERLKASGVGKWSRAKLGSIETRDHGVQSYEVKQLLDLYEVADENLRAWLVELALTPGERGYWRTIRKDLPKDFHEFASLEAALVAMRQFETMLIPGLLQTADYARAVINGVHPGLAPEVGERRVFARMSRQQVLDRTAPLDYHVILDEAVLERRVGSSLIMHHQLRRLVEEMEAGRVNLQVLPKAAGASPGLEGPFSVLTLPEPIPDFGYAEGPGGAAYIEDRADVEACTLRWIILTECALPQADSVTLIGKAAEGYQ
jgi:hypothetical protein